MKYATLIAVPAIAGKRLILVGDQRMDGFDRSRSEAILRKNGLL